MSETPGIGAAVEPPRNTRKFFKRGFAALLPTILTILVIVFAFQFLTDKISVPIGQAVLFAGDQVGGEPFDGFIEYWTGSRDLEALKADHWHHRMQNRKGYTAYEVLSAAVGFPAAFFGVFLVGIFLAGLIGRRLFSLLDRALSKFPVIKIIYPYAKQFSEFFFSQEQKLQFDAVVAVQYPRDGTYVLAFVTSEGLKKLEDETGVKRLTCFVPTSPTPVTGFVVFAPVDEVIPLPITIDEAARFFLSAGVLIPDHQRSASSHVPEAIRLPIVPDSAQAEGESDAKTSD